MVMVSLAVMPTLGWRWLLVFATIPVVIFLILCKVILNILFDSLLALHKEHWVFEYQVWKKSNTTS